MGKQVIDGEQRVAGVGTHRHADNGAVLHAHHPPQLQGDGHPLVFADTAVVVGLEEGQLAVLIEGGRLQIQPGAVDVGGGDGHALIQRRGADDGQVDAAAPVHPVYLGAGLELHAPLEGDKAGGLGQLHRIVHAVPLRLALVQEGFVALAVVGDGALGGLVHHVPTVFPLVQQRLPQLPARRFLFHVRCPPYK